MKLRGTKRPAEAAAGAEQARRGKAKPAQAARRGRMYWTLTSTKLVGVSVFMGPVGRGRIWAQGEVWKKATRR